MSPRRSAEEAAQQKSVAKRNSKVGGHQPISKDALFTNKKFAQVQPRFLDPARYVPTDNSPRRVVERRLQVERRELEWRNDFVMGSCKSFDDLMQFTLERDKRSNSPKASKLAAAFKDTPSMVSAYVKEGIPIRHHSMTALMEKRRAAELGVGVSGGEGVGAGAGVSSSSRAGSPNRPAAGGGAGSTNNSRTNSPHRHWSNAGSHGTTFSQRVSDTMASQVAFMKEQKHVERFVDEHLNKARVPADHVPRVATLAPGFRLQQMLGHHRESPRSREEGGVGARREESPCRGAEATREPERLND
jgi:hypothetical protein